MLNDLKRGFSIHFKAKTNYGKIYTETALASKSDVKNDFYDKLRAYVQPVDMNLQQWSAKVSIKCEEKWYQYAKKYAEQAKIEAESAPVLPAEEKLERKWHIFSSDESHGLVNIDSNNSLEAYNNTVVLENESSESYRAMYLTNCENSSYWGRWMISGTSPTSMWSKATQSLTQEAFESGSFGLVYEAAERKLSLVVDAAQSDNVILRIGAKFKRMLGVSDEIYYEVNGEPLLIV